MKLRVILEAAMNAEGRTALLLLQTELVDAGFTHVNKDPGERLTCKSATGVLWTAKLLHTPTFYPPLRYAFTREHDLGPSYSISKSRLGGYDSIHLLSAARVHGDLQTLLKLINLIPKR